MYKCVESEQEGLCFALDNGLRSRRSPKTKQNLDLISPSIYKCVESEQEGLCFALGSGLFRRGDQVLVFARSRHLGKHRKETQVNAHTHTHIYI